MSWKRWMVSGGELIDTRRRYGKTGLLIAVILLLVVDIFNMSWQRYKIAEDKRKRRECTEAVAVTISEVKSVKKTVSRRRGAGRYRRSHFSNYFLYYGVGTYTVDGEQYEFSLPRVEDSEEYYEGREYTLKYNKENAADYYIVGNNVNTDKFVFALIRIALYVVILVVLAINDSQGKVKKNEAGNFRHVSSTGSGADNDTWDPFNGM